jgi:hypothetical protein
MVGNESSSATNGSSVTSVAGKNRFPANPCAEAGSVATRQVLAASKISAIRPGIAHSRAERVGRVAGACREGGEADGSLGTVRDNNAKHAGDEGSCRTLLMKSQEDGSRRRCCRRRGDGLNPPAYSDRQSTGQAADWNCFRRFGGVGREREGEAQCGPRVATLHRHGAEPDNPMAMGLSADRSGEQRIATGA